MEFCTTWGINLPFPVLYMCSISTNKKRKKDLITLTFTIVTNFSHWNLPQPFCSNCHFLGFLKHNRCWVSCVYPIFFYRLCSPRIFLCSHECPSVIFLELLTSLPTTYQLVTSQTMANLQTCFGQVLLFLEREIS